MFIEEPVLAENGEAFVELSRQSCIPIATGERHYTRWGFKQLLAQGGVAIVQPDLSHAGGIWECRKIAAMAEAYDVAFAPHCPLGPIALASCLQVDFCTPNAVLQEQSLDVHYSAGTDAMKYILSPETFTFEAGYIRRPEGPGLGVVVNEDAIREAAAIGHRWRNPVWRNPDGCVTEW
jgi:galactonate dehydratase